MIDVTDTSSSMVDGRGRYKNYKTSEEREREREASN